MAEEELYHMAKGSIMGVSQRQLRKLSFLVQVVLSVRGDSVILELGTAARRAFPGYRFR